METTVEMRRHQRLETFRAIMVSPNGHMHTAFVTDLSVGGARLSLPDDLIPYTGMILKISFSCDSDAVLLLGRVVRVGVDHMGVKFEEDQRQGIRRVLEAAGSFH